MLATLRNMFKISVEIEDINSILTEAFFALVVVLRVKKVTKIGEEDLF